MTERVVPDETVLYVPSMTKHLSHTRTQPTADSQLRAAFSSDGWTQKSILGMRFLLALGV